MDKLQAFVSEQLKTEVPEVNIGDTVKVHDLIKEGTRERIQILREPLFLVAEAASARRSPSAVSPTV